MNGEADVTFPEGNTGCNTDALSWTGFFTTTGIESVPTTEVTDERYYDLSGRVLEGRPTEPGIYIHKGKAVSIR